MAIPSIYTPNTLTDLKARINNLTPNTERLWGTMTVNQMLEHCCRVMRVALGEEDIKASFLLKIFGPMIRKSIVDPNKKFAKDGPTLEQYKVGSLQPEFEQSKAQLITYLEKYAGLGAAFTHKKKHPVFGVMTSEEWSIACFKHLDHHLRQFGV